MFHRKANARLGKAIASKVTCPRCDHRQRAAYVPTGSADGASKRVCCLQCGHLFYLSSRSGDSKDEVTFEEAETQTHTGSKELRMVRYSLILVAAVALSVFAGIRIGMSRDEIATHPASQRPVKEDPTERARIQAAVKAAEATVKPEDEALRAFLGKFLAARSWTQLLPLVRNQSVAGPRMEAHYGDRRIEPYEDVVVSTKATRVGKLIVLTLTGKNMPNHRLVLEQTAGGYKADWEAFVVWQEAPWKSLRDPEHMSPAEIRCLIKPLPNQHPSMRRGSWLAFELYQPMTKEILYAYMEKAETLPEKTPRAVLSKGATGPCTLRVKASTDEEGNPVLVIDEVLALGWVYPLPPGHGEP